MKEYLNKFGTLNEYSNFKESSSFISPDVSYVAANSIVKYTPNKNYLIATFNIDSDYVDEPFKIGGSGASDDNGNSYIIEIDDTSVADSDITWIESRPYYTFNTTGEHTVAFKLPEDEEGSYIPDYMLAEVDHLIDTKIPEGLNSIGVEALNLSWDSEYNTVNFNIPSSVKEICELAFDYDCPQPQYIIFNSIIPPTLVSYYHDDWFGNQIIYVPKNAVSTYKAASYWNHYASQIFPIPDYPIDIREENKIEYKATAKLSFNTPRISGANIIRHEYGSGKGTIYLDKAIDILDGSFSGRTTLQEILLPGSVRDIEREAFSNCTNLTTVNLPQEMIEIKNRTFLNCYKLKNLGELNKIKSVGSWAFYNCQQFEDGDFIKNLEHIGYSAFQNTGLTSVYLSDNLRSIEGSAFSNCPYLSYVRIPQDITKFHRRMTMWNMFPGCSRLQTAGSGQEFNIDIKTLDKEIPDGMFGSFSYLTSIILPNGLKRIGNSAFSGCSNLTKIKIPNGVTEIGGMAFYSCNNLNDITIPETVTIIGGSSFWRSNRQLTAGPIGGNYNIKFGWKTKIPKSAFYNCTLSSITFPDTITEIGKDACSGNNFSTITLPSSLLTIGESAFSSNSQLQTVTGGNNIREIESQAFSSCTNLRNLHFDKLKHIRKNAFYNCSNLQDFYFPPTLTSIGKEAFQGCTSLIYGSLYPKVKTIQKGTFKNCSSLRQVSLQDVDKILDRAFENTYNLYNQIILGTTVKELGEYIFYNSNISSIKLQTITPPAIKPNTFDNPRSLYNIYVPNNSLNTYKTAWPQVANRIIGYNP